MQAHSVYLDGIKNIDGVEVVSLIGRDLEKTKEVAQKYGIAHVTADLSESLALEEVDAVILCRSEERRVGKECSS